MKFIIVAIAALLALPTLALAQQPSAAKVKALAAPEDPRQKTVLVGRSEAAGMIIQFEIEPGTTMLMPMGTPSKFVEHAPAVGEIYHLEVKPIDPRSKTRIAYAVVTFEATNRDSGKTLRGELHPMWGGSGLHYALNSALADDGTYDFVITVQPPSFSRSVKDKELFATPATARFHFKLKGGALIEVSEPIAAPTN
jgi:uncharacterized protein involved in high-affinity Fe2+ transport